MRKTLLNLTHFFFLETPNSETFTSVNTRCENIPQMFYEHVHLSINAPCVHQFFLSHSPKSQRRWGL